MITNKFKDLLDKRNINITELSNITGISRTTLTSLYYKRTEKLSLIVLDKICNVLGCTIEDIFEFSDNCFDQVEECKTVIYYRLELGDITLDRNIFLNTNQINLVEVFRKITKKENCQTDNIVICNIIKI